MHRTATLSLRSWFGESSELCQSILHRSWFWVCFFFQAEDGIRDHCVTGVQTCALPISCFMLPITMLACARLGVVHSVVFGGFSGEACGLRAADSGSRVLIYADGYHRNGKWEIGRASCRERV